MKPLLIGHVFLIVCCGFYLAWWYLAFRPGYAGSRVSGIAGALLLITAICGFIGIGFSVTGILRDGARSAFIPSAAIVIGGILVYLLLMAGSSLLLHRQVTTELFLILGWLVLELLSFQTSYRLEATGFTGAVILSVLAALAAILSLFLYLEYYRVSDMRGYIYGMVPLITEALCMVVFLIFCFRKN